VGLSQNDQVKKISASAALRSDRLLRSDLTQRCEGPGSYEPGPPGLSQGAYLTALDQIGGEAVAVVLALAHPVGGVTGMHEGHHGDYGHHRDEHEADQDDQ
jgi:hypothetical protein